MDSQDSPTPTCFNFKVKKLRDVLKGIQRRVSRTTQHGRVDNSSGTTTQQISNSSSTTSTSTSTSTRTQRHRLVQLYDDSDDAFFSQSVSPTSVGPTVPPTERRPTKQQQRRASSMGSRSIGVATTVSTVSSTPSSSDPCGTAVASAGDDADLNNSRSNINSNNDKSGFQISMPTESTYLQQHQQQHVLSYPHQNQNQRHNQHNQQPIPVALSMHEQETETQRRNETREMEAVEETRRERLAAQLQNTVSTDYDSYHLRTMLKMMKLRLVLKDDDDDNVCVGLADDSSDQECAEAMPAMAAVAASTPSSSPPPSSFARSSEMLCNVVVGGSSPLGVTTTPPPPSVGATFDVSSAASPAAIDDASVTVCHQSPAPPPQSFTTPTQAHVQPHHHHHPTTSPENDARDAALSSQSRRPSVRLSQVPFLRLLRYFEFYNPTKATPSKVTKILKAVVGPKSMVLCFPPPQMSPPSPGTRTDEGETFAAHILDDSAYVTAEDDGGTVCAAVFDAYMTELEAKYGPEEVVTAAWIDKIEAAEMKTKKMHQQQQQSQSHEVLQPGGQQKNMQNILNEENQNRPSSPQLLDTNSNSNNKQNDDDDTKLSQAAAAAAAANDAHGATTTPPRHTQHKQQQIIKREPLAPSASGGGRGNGPPYDRLMRLFAVHKPSKATPTAVNKILTALGEMYIDDEVEGAEEFGPDTSCPAFEEYMCDLCQKYNATMDEEEEEVKETSEETEATSQPTSTRPESERSTAEDEEEEGELVIEEEEEKDDEMMEEMGLLRSQSLAVEDGDDASQRRRSGYDDTISPGGGGGGGHVGRKKSVGLGLGLADDDSGEFAAAIMPAMVVTTVSSATPSFAKSSETVGNFVGQSSSLSVTMTTDC